MSKAETIPKVRVGFTLVELAVVIVIIGVLAAFGVPRFIKSVERSKASEAFSYLSAVRAAQQRYHAREGAYASDLSAIDLKYGTPRYFIVGTISAAAGDDSSLRTSWTMTLTRTGASAGYGAYTVTFNQDGYDETNSSIDGYPDVNPMSNEPNVGAAGGPGR